MPLFRRRRVIKIQHGRVSMLACIIYIVPESFEWPVDCSPPQQIAFEDITNGLAACAKILWVGWLQTGAFVGSLEVSNCRAPRRICGRLRGLRRLRPSEGARHS